MPSSALNWRAVEQTLFDVWWSDFQAFVEAHPGELFYAFAIYGWSLDDDTCSLPCLSANSEQALSEDFPGTDSSERWSGTTSCPRWSPPDWRWHAFNEGRHHPEIEALAQEIQRLWLLASPEQEARLNAALGVVLVRVARRLRRALRHGRLSAGVAEDVVVLVIGYDGDTTVEESARLLRLCVGPARFAKLFFRLDRWRTEARRVQTLGLKDQVRYHVACVMGQAAPDLGLDVELAEEQREAAQSALRRMDGPLVAATLVAQLRAHPDDAAPAFMLAQTDYVDNEVLHALRRKVLHNEGDTKAVAWSARALGQRGDSAWLLDQAMAATPLVSDEMVVDGLTYPYLDWHSEERLARPILDYRPLEQALRLLPRLDVQLDARLRSVPCVLRARDVAEALRGLGSAFPLIRRHAADALGRPMSEPDFAQRIVQAMAHALRCDEDETVRYLAAEALRAWKSAAVPQLPVLAEAERLDSAQRVRDAARDAAKQLATIASTQIQ